MGPPLHLVPGAPGPGGDLTPPRLFLLAASDDFLLELNRSRIEAEWRADNPEGEIQHLDPTPAPEELLQALAAPSLFAPARLLVVRNATPYLDTKAKGGGAGGTLAEGLRAFFPVDATLLLVATVDREPSGPLTELAADIGTVRWSPLPPPPKPWEEIRISAEQRRVLEEVLRIEVPEVLPHREAVERLLETYGFRPRDLARAARQLVTAGDISAEAVTAQAGPGECALQEVEDILARRDVRRLTAMMAVLAAGGELRDWRGDRVAVDRSAAVLVGLVGRLLRRSLALHGYARAAGLANELDPRRCAAGRWYPQTFKPRIHPALTAAMKAAGDDKAAKASPWQLHKAFKLAAAYSEGELVRAMARLVGTGIERDASSRALLAVTAGLLELVTPAA